MKVKIYIAILLLGLVGTSCTQNNGHIGNLFGAWVMTEMTVDGEPKVFPDEVYTTVAFQNDVVRFDYHYAYGSYYERYGTWTLVDNTLTLVFNHHDDQYGPGGGSYGTPDWLGFPTDKPVEVTMSEAGSSRMTWITSGADGEVLIYKFERTW